MQQMIRIILGLSLSASVLAVGILLVRFIFRERIKSSVMLLIWAVLALRLMIPYTPENPLSLFRFAPESIAQTVAIQPARSSAEALAPQALHTAGTMEIIRSTSQNRSETIDPSTTEPVQIRSVETAKSDFPLWTAVFFIWLSGACMFMFTVSVSNLRFFCLLRRNRPIVDAFFDSVFSSAMHTVGLKNRRITTVAVDAQTSPAVFGCIKPRLLIPLRTFDALRVQDQYHVLCHELMHIKHHDLWFELLGLILLGIHWFNPLMWLSYRAFRQDIESLCDQRTIRALAHTPLQYADSLLHVTQALGDLRHSSALLLAAVDTKNQLKRRLRMLAKPRKFARLCSITAVLLTILSLLAGCAAASAIPKPQLSVVSSSIQPTPTKASDAPIAPVQPEKQESRPMPEGYTGTLFTLPETMTLLSQAEYQTYPQLESWGYALNSIKQPKQVDFFGTICAIWQAYEVTESSLKANLSYVGSNTERRYLYLNEVLNLSEAEMIAAYGHNELITRSDAYSIHYLWGTDFSKSDPLTYSAVTAEDPQALFEQYYSEMQRYLLTDGSLELEKGSFSESEPRSCTLNVRIQGGENTLRGEFVIRGEGITQAYIHAPTEEHIPASAPQTPLSLEEALYSLNYNRAYFTLYGSGGKDGAYSYLQSGGRLYQMDFTEMEDHAILTKPDAQIIDVALAYAAMPQSETYNQRYEERFYLHECPVFLFTVRAGDKIGIIHVDCATGNLHDSDVSSDYPVILSPYPARHGQTLTAYAPDEADGTALESAQILEEFFTQMWNAFYTLESPQLPDVAEDTPNVHLYLRWVDHRIAEITHPLNKSSQFATEPQVHIGYVTIQSDDGVTISASCPVDIRFESSGSGVNGFFFDLNAKFKRTEVGLMLTELTPDYHYPTYQSLRAQFDKIELPTVDQVDALLDGAIRYFNENN